MQTLQDAGVHMGYARSRRHPSATPFIYGTKDRADVFDLEETARRLERAREFLAECARSGGAVLFVGGKSEVAAHLKATAEAIGAPYVAGRWIGGTLTNFKNIRKRVERLEKLLGERERGELGKYTKRERLLIDREIDELERRFGGIVSLTDLPRALFVIDTRHESTAVREANQLGIPVIALASTDCDFSQVQYPIPGNDTSVKSVKHVLERVAEAYQEGKRAAAQQPKTEADAAS